MKLTDQDVQSIEPMFKKYKQEYEPIIIEEIFKNSKFNKAN